MVGWVTLMRSTRSLVQSHSQHNWRMISWRVSSAIALANSTGSMGYFSQIDSCLFDSIDFGNLMSNKKAVIKRLLGGESVRIT